MLADLELTQVTRTSERSHHISPTGHTLRTTVALCAVRRPDSKRHWIDSTGDAPEDRQPHGAQTERNAQVPQDGVAEI